LKNNICLYIHWPWCNHICNYCDYYKFKNKNTINYEKVFEGYLRDLKYLDNLICNKTIISLTIGGGSPSLINVKFLKKLLDHVKKKYKFAKKTEVSIEVNPQDVNRKKLKEYKKIGFNRVCIGVQSFSNKELRQLGKAYTKEQAISSIYETSNYFSNTCIDLIYGIPNSNIKSFEKQLYFSSRLPVKHISTYEFNFLGEKKSFGLNLNFLKKSIEVFKKKKFFLYEINSFSINGYQSLYNNAILQMKDYVGIGPSSHSRVIKNNIAIKNDNTRNLNDWLNEKKNTYSTEMLCKEKQIEEFLLLGLSRCDGISYKELKKITSNNIEKYVNLERLNFLEDNGFLLQKNGKVFLHNKGLLLINSIISHLLT